MSMKYLSAIVYGSNSTTRESLENALRIAFQSYTKEVETSRDKWRQKTIEILSTAKRRRKVNNKMVTLQQCPLTMAKCELYGKTEDDLKEVEQTLKKCFPKVKWDYPKIDENHDEVDDAIEAIKPGKYNIGAPPLKFKK